MKLYNLKDHNEQVSFAQAVTQGLGKNQGLFFPHDLPEFSLTEIDEMLNEKTTGWKTGRMNKVDLTILRLAVYEILWDDDIPSSVAINEAVVLAKKFSGEDGPSFVNGVLAKFV